MIDNIELIKPLLNFEKKGDFYFCLILKRKKDQPEGERDNHQSVRTIKTYCIDSIEYLEKRYDEMKQLCEFFKARAYIQVQKQNHFDVGMKMITEIVTRVQSGQINQKNIFDSIVGQIKTKEKRWVVDVDTNDAVTLTDIMLTIGICKPYDDDSKILASIPTKNGFHLITKRFDVMEFKKKYPNVDVIKKNPTLLYLPNSLE
jgi:hypothetical protein